MQVSAQYSGVIDTIRKTYAAEGIGAFYLSFPVTLMMSIPFQMIQFTTYEYFRRKLNPTGVYDPISHSIAGGIAGGVASGITNPMDVAKTVLQTKGLYLDQTRNVTSFRDSFALIYKMHGLGGFTRGLGARVAAHVPSTAVAWTTYEFLKMALTSNAGIAAEIL
jgi:hypothetical protein